MPAKNIYFPKENGASLMPQDYNDFFSSQATLCTNNKQVCTSLTLTCGDKNTLQGLMTYLQQSPGFFTKELIINLQPSAFGETYLQEVIKLLAVKGVTSVKLTSNETQRGAANQLLEIVKQQKLTMDIELWAGNEIAQREIDQCTSIFQREQRIAAFKETVPQPSLLVAKDKPKRQRKKNTKVDIDTEIEVQVEVAAEIAVEKAVEEQFEDETIHDFIDREEFVRRLKTQAFSIEPAFYGMLAGHENRTWDRWMGNIHQAVVEPAKKRKKVGIWIAYPGSVKPDFDYYYTVYGDLNSFANLSFYAWHQGRNTFSSVEQGLSFSTKEVRDFIAKFFPEAFNGNVFSKELSDIEWQNALPQSYSNLYQNYPLYDIDEEELFKGKYIVDADTLAEDQASLEALKANCPISFKNPAVNLRLFSNPKVSLMTTKACEQLLTHQRQLQYGLDFDHLPMGFEFIEEPIDGKLVAVLNYNERKARIKNKDPYAIHLCKPESVLPLSHDLFDQWRNKSTNSLLKQQYETLENTGDRQKIVEFKRYLPVMLYLPPKLLTQFGKEPKDLIEAAIHHKDFLHTIKGNLKSHLLVQFLENEKAKDLLKTLEQWHTRLDLTAADLNGLLAVYNSYGLDGLSRLFHVWEKTSVKTKEGALDVSLLKNLQNHYFKQCDSFVPLLDPSFEEAVNIIKHFSQEEHYFWDVLSAQHMAAVGYDELLPLVKAFQDFSVKIKEKNLVFYKECQFSQVKHLQLALSRMLAILNKTKPQDLQLVWKQISLLDLQSNGAIRLVNETNCQEQCVLPEMKLSPVHYAEEHDSCLNHSQGKKATKLPDHGYYALKVTHEDPKRVGFWKDAFELRDEKANGLQEIIAFSKTPEELKKNYYRYLSAKEYRLSLDFYQKAADFLDKTIDNIEVRAGFYALIAASTSGFGASSHIQDEATSLDDLSKLWELFKAINFLSVIPFPQSTLRLFILRSFLKLTPMAPLPYLLRLMVIAQKAFTFNWSEASIGIEAYRTRNHQVSETLRNITSVSDDNGYAFYEGIQFVDLNTITHQQYLEFSQLAVEINANPDVDSFRGALIRLMSTFQLNQEVLDEIPKINCPVNILANCLSLLTKMQTNISPDSKQALTQNDLLKFIESLKVKYAEKPADMEDDELIIQCIQDKLADHFAKDFFKEVRNSGLSDELETQLKRDFDALEEQDLVRKILLSFHQLQDKLHRHDALNQLTLIAKRLQAEERKQFFNQLVTLNTSDESTLLEFNALLSAIGERGKIDDFVFMINCAQQQSEPVSNLIPKITLYFQTLPFLYGRKRDHLTLADLQPLAANLALNYPKESASFKTSFEELNYKLEELIDYCPNEKTGVLDVLNQFIIAAKNFPEYTALSFVTFLAEAAKFGEGPDIIRSLSDHYSVEPLALYSLLDLIKDPKEWDQRSILLMITSLLNNGRACKLEVIKEFLDLCNQEKIKEANPTEKSPLFIISKTFFKCPPYPTFEQIISWHKQYQGAQDYTQKMAEAYRQYSFEPCKREPENGFKLAEALDFASHFEGIRFDEEELKTLAKETESVKQVETESLKKELVSIKNLPDVERVQHNPRLLAILAELLYRSKGSAGGNGLSYEMNTMQYLAVYVFLKYNGHVTEEMATGEGKSRTMMVGNACGFILNKTVDFVTSDMQLAQRDYLEYQAFFKILDAEIRLISSTSPANAYKFGGVHFSDAANLSLFRNKARCQHKGKLVIDPAPTKRALLLDEADRTYYDISETRFNFSDLPKDNAIKNMEWIYPLLVRFFNQPDPAKKALCEALFEHDIDGCTSSFLDFIRAQSGVSEEMLAQIEEVPTAQLESWQEAAVTALHLKLGTDYALEPNVLIETAHGPKLATEARLIYGHRLSKNSKFSFGVHQCLHAHLNGELQNPDSEVSRKCAELVRLQNEGKKNPSTTVQPFFIHPEKQIVYSTTSKSFLDDYQSGDLWAVTGTGGSILEREEAGLLYGKNEQPMEFVTVPRKNNLQRKDHLLHLTANFKQRVAVILTYIEEARQQGRPVLLVCEDDTQAALIRDALQALLAKKPESKRIPSEQWQFVDSTCSSSKEKTAIANAGKPGMVTISTSRMGRGTDIKLTNDAKAAGGLSVLVSYLPREREQFQIWGRGGRYGDPGDARIIVDKEQLCHQFGTKSLATDFFLANEFYVQSKQAHMDKEKQVERLIRNSLSDFRMKITDAFFNYYDALPSDTPEENKKAIDYWAQFTKKTDQLWNQMWPELDVLVKQPQINIPKVKAHLAKFQHEAQKGWGDLYIQLSADAKLPPKLTDLKLDTRTEYLLQLILPKRRYTKSNKTQVYQTYEKALDGRAVIYDELFTELKATWRGQRKVFANTRAWLNGHGLLFADTRALLAGKRQLFATLRTWINKNHPEKAETQLPCHNILDALKQHNSKQLGYFVRHQDVSRFLEPPAGDFLLGFKIQLIEAVLDYAHSKLERSNYVPKKDMDLMHKLLMVVKGNAGNQDDLISAVKKELLPAKAGFFGRSLKHDVNAVIKQRIQEQAEENLQFEHAP